MRRDKTGCGSLSQVSPQLVMRHVEVRRVASLEAGAGGVLLTNVSLANEIGTAIAGAVEDLRGRGYS
jgi:hypothetical protein